MSLSLNPPQIVVLQIVDVPVRDVRRGDAHLGSGILQLRSLDRRITPDITLILDTGDKIELGYYNITAHHGSNGDRNFVASKDLGWRAPTPDICSRISHLTIFLS